MVCAAGLLASSVVLPASSAAMPVGSVRQVAATSHYQPRPRARPAAMAFSDSGTATKIYVAHMHPVKKPKAPVNLTPQQYAVSLFPQYGWTKGEYGCLNSVWTRESGWRYNAYNPSGAFGIPQALPGSKMATAGADWATNPETQIKWGLGYIHGRYTTPCGAWRFWERHSWY